MNTIEKMFKETVAAIHSWDVVPPIQKFGIETTTRCNSRCLHCNHETCMNLKDSRLNRDIDPKIFYDSIEFMKKFNLPIKEIYPSGLGEPLMNPHIFEYIISLKKNFPSAGITIFENGNLLEGERAKKLIETDSVGYIIISLSFNCRKVYKKKIQLDNYDRVMKNIKNFLAQSIRPPTEIHVFDEWDNIVRLPKMYMELKPYLRPGDKLNIMREYNLVDFEHDDSKLYPCDQLWGNTLLIDIDGNVYPCCGGHWFVDSKWNRDFLKLGTIYDDPNTIIENMHKLRNRQEEFKLGKCRECGYIQREQRRCKEKYKRRQSAKRKRK
jgi:radical SAM protein with 4Fe4S-binding SPASM domain